MELVALGHGHREKSEPYQSKIEDRESGAPIAVPVRMSPKKASISAGGRSSCVDDAMLLPPRIRLVALRNGASKIGADFSQASAERATTDPALPTMTQILGKRAEDNAVADGLLELPLRQSLFPENRAKDRHVNRVKVGRA